MAKLEHNASDWDYWVTADAKSDHHPSTSWVADFDFKGAYRYNSPGDWKMSMNYLNQSWLTLGHWHWLRLK